MTVPCQFDDRTPAWDVVSGPSFQLLAASGLLRFAALGRHLGAYFDSMGLIHANGNPRPGFGGDSTARRVTSRHGFVIGRH
jgi:hypothetical protein